MSRVTVALTLGILATVAAGLLVAAPAHGFRQTGPFGIMPSTDAVVGSNLLADPGLAINAGSTGQACISFKGSALSDYLCDVAGGGFTFAQGSIGRLSISSSGTLTPNGPIAWNNGTDLSETNAPRADYSVFWPSNFAGTATFGNFEPSVASHVRSFHAFLITQANCTVSPVVQVTIGGVNQAASAMTITNATSLFDVTGLNLAVNAGARIQLSITTAGTCTTQPSSAQFGVEYSTD